MQQAAAFISAVLILLAGPPYIINTIRRRTQPERATWFIFSVLGLIALGSQLSLGANWSLVFTALDTLGSIATFGLSLWYGVGGFTKLDRLALAIAAIGVLVAVIAHAPLVALSGVILADVSGTLLTVRKAYQQPETETTISWLLVGTAALFGMLAVGRLQADLLLFPAYLLLANYSVPLAQLTAHLRHR